MAIMVFGGSGFLGRYLIDEILNRAEEGIVNCDIIPFNNDVVEDNHVDISDKSLVQFLINDRKPLIIFHLAGMTNIESCCTADIEEVLDVNLRGTINILESNIGPGQILIFASSLYANSTIAGPYGIFKRTCEDLIRYYAKKKRFEYMIFRLGTVYGPGAGDYNSITKTIRKAFDTGVISYYGLPDNVREYIHVADAAKAIVDLSINPKNEIVNIIGNNPTKAKDLLNMIKDIMGDDFEINFEMTMPENHYNVVPYKFAKIRKYFPREAIDLGEGIYQVIYDVAGIDNE